jgi:hypothetical protein
MSLTIGLITGFGLGIEVIFVDEEDKKEMECSFMICMDVGIFRIVSYF